ncbi:hypothetical protein ACGFI9_21360 [Micromonospora sp. NPDC048930]|uniref:hypothetical protein n=1 Tax=Micromonospora sp. NPDC048930 TaxID=3364261 RepID=UPI0037203BB0
MSESAAAEREPDPTSERLTHRGGTPEPDVLVDIPEVTVDQLRLAVDGLDADLSLRARLANLVQLDAGVRVHLQGVELDVTGVSAEALLKVRLEKLVQILDRALTTLDRNPQIIDALARAAGVPAEDVNRVVQQATGGAPVVNQAGQHIGAVGAVADRTLRNEPPGLTPPTPPPAGARTPEPPTGPTGQQPAPTSATAPGPTQTGGPAGPAGAVQLAGQAGEHLRQAGRSVWEAIQSGMGQHREERPKR